MCLTTLDKVNIHTAIECPGLEAKATTFEECETGGIYNSAPVQPQTQETALS